EEKGYLRHEKEKGRFIYYPTIPLKQARTKALDHVVETFFKGAEASAVISILKKGEANLSDDDAEMIIDLIRKSREEGL
ncbi:MAG TPA: BlaI/MecI/CopY family transcriptional regulator, partial [Candidatus Krumholzibacterium sp.]|nr:BlaI/MecI/CopY family transcriptional regulator [Candidatus Krumholzibacterium sp.]